MPDEPQEQQPDRDAPGGLTGSPEALLDAANGREVSDDGEESVLDFLVGPTYRPEFYVDMDFETPKGMRRLRVYFRAQDERTMDRIDGENRKGDGPFSKLDRTGFNSQLAAEAVSKFEDVLKGRSMAADDPAFRGQVPDVQSAMEGRFRYQPGLLDSLVGEIRAVSGYAPERVTAAQRVVSTAVGNSSSGGDS